MAYLKPPWFVRKIFNRVAMATGVGNSQTLTVLKRAVDVFRLVLRPLHIRFILSWRLRRLVRFSGGW